MIRKSGLLQGNGKACNMATVNMHPHSSGIDSSMGMANNPTHGKIQFLEEDLEILGDNLYLRQ